MIVRSTIVWKDGRVTQKDFDFDNQEETRLFARSANQALKLNAMVTTIKVDKDDETNGRIVDGLKLIIGELSPTNQKMDERELDNLHSENEDDLSYD